MDKNSFNNALAKAQRLMLDEGFNRQVEMGAAAERAVNKRGGGGNNADLKMLEEMAGFSSSPSVAPIPENAGYGGRKSGLPKEIVESFNRMPAMGGDVNFSSSVLDDITRTLSQNGGGQRQMVNEQTAYPQVTGGVDYSVIRAIVENCLKEYSKGMLNEGTIRGFKLAKGNKIQVVDAKGNLYEGVLKLKKKAKS